MHFTFLLDQSTVNLSVPLFSNVTHLQVLSHWSRWTTWKWDNPAHLPALTHLSLCTYGDDALTSPRLAQTIGTILRRRPNLRTCALRVNRNYDLTIDGDIERMRGSDSRLVIVRCPNNPREDWQKHMQCGNSAQLDDEWVMAAKLVRSGHVRVLAPDKSSQKQLTET
jgi:hypothetical protein